MEPNSGQTRRRFSKRRRSGFSAAGPQRARSKHRAPPSSFAPPPPPSRRTIRFPAGKRSRPVFKVFLAAFLGVFLLVRLGGGHNAAALGLALILPGVALLVKPPTSGLGKWGDLGAVGLLGVLLLAFLPQFHWPAAEWRTEAVESFGIRLPAVLSVQPWISLEAWIMAVAGFAWFYAALQWRVNFRGRRWLFFWLSVLLAGIAGAEMWGHLLGSRYPGAEGATAFSFFPNRNQTANFLALGGVATFAYAMDGLRSRTVLPLVGAPASALCLAGLALEGSRAGVLLYLVGVGLWFLFSLRAHSLPRFLKVGFPVAAVALGVIASCNEKTAQRIVDFAASDAELKDELRLKIYEDSVGMVLDAPLSGFGVGNFPAVFPQYRQASANFQALVHPESDLFWLAAEGGLLAVGFFTLFLLAYFRSCRESATGASSAYRVLALAVVLVFLIHALVDVPAHRPGTVYFAILFAALALPRRNRPAVGLPPVFWRILGGGLLAVGTVWFAAGVFRQPWHSSVMLPRFEESIRRHTDVGDFGQAREAADRWIALKPLDWRPYFRRAQITLAESGETGEADADFRRARFVEPVLGAISYEEGEVWLPHDPARAVAAWRETLNREMEDMDRTYRQMLDRAIKSPPAMERMARLSDIDPHYRAYFLGYLGGEALMRELSLELAEDPDLSRFSRGQRSAIVKNWITRGGAPDPAEAFLKAHGESLEDSWWLWSLLHKERADFKQAVEAIRENIEVPELPEIRVDDGVMARLMREHAVAPKDIMKGTALLYVYVERGQYEKALPVLDSLLEARKPPAYLDYWRAECLYRVREYIESWYSFEAYLNKIREE